MWSCQHQKNNCQKSNWKKASEKCEWLYVQTSFFQENLDLLKPIMLFATNDNCCTPNQSAEVPSDTQKHQREDKQDKNARACVSQPSAVAWRGTSAIAWRGMIGTHLNIGQQAWSVLSWGGLFSWNMFQMIQRSNRQRARWIGTKELARKVNTFAFFTCFFERPKKEASKSKLKKASTSCH
jgi:hypothetical protein